MRKRLGLVLASLLSFLPISSVAQTQVGAWQNITPPAVQLPGAYPCDYGTVALALDPSTPSTVYLGTCEQGLWKSLDSGNTWTHINTGTNGNVLDTSRQWTLVVDPVSPQTIYTNSGYGKNGENGAWKSNDGGVNWSRIWPSPSQRNLDNIVQYNFVAQVALDPTDHNHLFLSWHGFCAAPYTPVCYGESKDAGATWTIRNGDTRWVASEAQTLYVIDGQRMLFANHSDGLWRTSDGGQTWTLIDKNGAGHWPSTLYHSPTTGIFYIGSDYGVWHSADFINWTLDSVGYVTTGVLGDGKTLFVGNAGALTPWVPAGTNVYLNAPEATGTPWTAAPWTAPAGAFTQGPGGGFAYDPIHHLLFSSNGTIGLFRIQTSAATVVPPPPPILCQQPVYVNGVLKFKDQPASYCDGAK